MTDLSHCDRTVAGHIRAGDGIRAGHRSSSFGFDTFALNALTDGRSAALIRHFPSGIHSGWPVGPRPACDHSMRTETNNAIDAAAETSDRLGRLNALPGRNAESDGDRKPISAPAQVQWVWPGNARLSAADRVASTSDWRTTGIRPSRRFADASMNACYGPEATPGSQRNDGFWLGLQSFPRRPV